MAYLLENRRSKSGSSIPKAHMEYEKPRWTLLKSRW